MTCELAVLDHTGDTKHMWDSDVAAEVEAAKATFNTLKSKGYAIFRSDKKGEKSGQMREFDPHAERMIAVPPMVGG